MKKVKFDVQGMTCSSCSSHVERAVKKLEGIHSANVNLLSNNMIVEYNEKILDNKKIIEAVIEAGYGASLSDENREEIKSESNILNQEEDLIYMKKRLIISVIFLIPLMYVAMHHMLYDWFGIPIPEFINNLFHGAENALTFGFVQLLLLLPIVYVNRNYFIIGFKKLIKRTPNMDSLIAIGSSSAIIYGIYAIFMIGYGLGHNQLDLVQKYSMDLYFESAGTILTLITVRKIFGNKIKRKNN